MAILKAETSSTSWISFRLPNAVAKKLNRNYLGVELEPAYIEIARKRIDDLPTLLFDETELVTKSKRMAPRVSFGQLIEAQYIKPGQKVYSKNRNVVATVKADSQLLWWNMTGSIHRVAALAQNKSAFNGWEYWYCEDQEGNFVSIDQLREQYRIDNNGAAF